MINNPPITRDAVGLSPKIGIATMAAENGPRYWKNDAVKAVVLFTAI